MNVTARKYAAESLARFESQYPLGMSSFSESQKALMLDLMALAHLDGMKVGAEEIAAIYSRANLIDLLSKELLQ